MFTVFTERETGGRPSEHDSAPAADGDPGRSPAEQKSLGIELVSDDTEEFEEQQTGVFLACDPTDAEIRENIHKTGFLRTSDVLNYIMAAVVVIYIVGNFSNFIRDGSVKNWIILICEFVVAAALFLMPLQNLNMEKNRYRENGMGKITIYPDRIELTESGKELPLDGTGEMLRTETAFTLVYPPEKESHNRALRFLIIPRRCVSGDLLPYVEAMLAAGTRPRIE